MVPKIPQGAAKSVPRGPKWPHEKPKGTPCEPTWPKRSEPKANKKA